MKYDLKNHELDNNFFNFPEVLSNDFLKIDSFDANIANFYVFSNIKELVLDYLKKNKELSIDSESFRVKEIKYTKNNNPFLSVYAVSGVSLNVFDKEVKYEGFYRYDSDYPSLYYKLPNYINDETTNNIIIFIDALNQLIKNQRSFIDYSKEKFIMLDNEDKFIKDCYYFKYLLEINDLTPYFYNNYDGEYQNILDFIFIFSNTDFNNHIDDNYIKGVIYSYVLFISYIFRTIKNTCNSYFEFKDYYKYILKNKVIQGRNPLLLNKEYIKEGTELIVKYMEIISSKEFKDSVSLEKARMLLKS